MDNNISQSNSKLKQAASQNPDTSPRVDQSTEQAYKVSSSQKQDSQIVGSENQSFKKSVENYTKSTKSRPSYEGYMKSSSAHIQMNGKGYDSAKHQQARQNKLNNPRPIAEFSKNNFNAPSSLIKGGIINSTKSSLNANSKSMMDKNLKINNLF
jgi:hypothetical protein